MKKNFAISALVFIVIALAVTLVFEKREAQEVTTTEITTTETTTIEETTTEESTTEETTTEEITSIEETTSEDISEKETQIYENLELFKEIKVLTSELPFVISGVDSIETVKMHIPRQPIGDEDVWENTYIEIECLGKAENVAIKFDPANGIYTGNIVPKNEMLHSNLTYLYINGEYSQNYTYKKDGEMIILTDFSEGTTEIKICNRSANPIFEGKIDGEDVIVNDIIIRFN